MQSRSRSWFNCLSTTTSSRTSLRGHARKAGVVAWDASYRREMSSSGPVVAGQAFGIGLGMRLSAGFFDEHVAPLADARLGRGRYAAALVGGGSEVLGLDTEMSADHDWGPRITLFVDRGAVEEAKTIARDLPGQFRGVSRSFGAAAGGAPWVNPFEVTTVDDYFRAWIGFHQRAEATLIDWLANPAMSFLAVTAGAVFHDGPGSLLAAREAAGWYPEDVWRWLVACQWCRIAEEHPFLGRTVGVGDRVGAALVAASLVREGIRLFFLLERRYAPYAKWLGSAFGALPNSAELRASFGRAVAAPTDDGPDALCEAFEALGALTNARFDLSVDPTRRQYFGRPITVAPAGDFSSVLLASVDDPQLRGLATNIGNVDMLFGTNNGGFPGATATYRHLLAVG